MVKDKENSEFETIKGIKDKKLEYLLNELRKTSKKASEFIDNHMDEFNVIHADRFFLKTIQPYVC